MLESAPSRANLVARAGGTGQAGPLLLSAHLDVVEADAGKWQRPPFAGVIADGCLWGRGAIDMKNMAAMSVAIMRRLAVDKPALARDVIFAGVADEEAGCDHGSRFLVEQHPELVRAEYALGELGRILAPPRGHHAIMSAGRRRRACAGCAPACRRGRPRARCRGGTAPPSGCRGPRPPRQRPAPGARHPLRPGRQCAAVAARQPRAARPLLRLLRPARAPGRRVLRLVPDLGTARALGALLSNTASPTVVRAGMDQRHPGRRRGRDRRPHPPGARARATAARAPGRARPRRRARAIRSAPATVRPSRWRRRSTT
ncbi:MAG: M20/M25/M40 family metallo-hydrolase [Kofleriaceae bacterium]|nr:M20/M25/M40 family metallo-hydrolase [Kofleriaceae bacterium]